MKGFKDSTKTVYTQGGPAGVKGAARAASVMRAFKKGPMKKAEGGRVSDVEQPSRPMTADQVRRITAVKRAAAAAPKREPLVNRDLSVMVEVPSRPMKRK